MLQETKDKNITTKRKRYQSALNDKNVMRNIRQEINRQQNNKNCFRHAKVKQQYYEGKTNKLKKNLTKKNEEFIEEENDLKELKLIGDKMMKTYNQLELIEKQCIENLNKTKYLNEKFKKKKSINIYKNIKPKLNIKENNNRNNTKTIFCFQNKKDKI